MLRFGFTLPLWDEAIDIQHKEIRLLCSFVSGEVYSKRVRIIN